MDLSTLPKIVTRRKKRLGRGHGSGKVKTSGRGTKGQKARGSIPSGFEGGQLSLVKRLPYLRGKKRNNSSHVRSFPVDVGKLSMIPKDATVTLEVLRTHAVIGRTIRRVKLLGTSKLTASYTVLLPCSKSAKASIEEAGGTVAGS
ncbi:MAG: 50S ribosomal protein L15 [bacterium]|nr:50S ribosomal protein L15 [bacterium]